jgi:hypothetical protein
VVIPAQSVALSGLRQVGVHEVLPSGPRKSVLTGAQWDGSGHRTAGGPFRISRRPHALSRAMRMTSLSSSGHAHAAVVAPRMTQPERLGLAESADRCRATAVDERRRG